MQTILNQKAMQRKTEKIEVYMTEGLKTLIWKAAKVKYKSMSQYMRDCALDKLKSEDN